MLYGTTLPDNFIEKTEVLLKQFAASIDRLTTSPSDYTEVMRNVEVLVVALNDINHDFDYNVIETDEREELCAYIDGVIMLKCIDIDALATFNRCGRHELTDRWREW